MHELARQYAAEKLEQSSAAQRVRDMHCAYYCTVLEQFAAEIKGPRQDVALARMDLESENARAAWDWAVEGDPEHVLDRKHIERLDRAAEGLAHFYDRRYRYLQAETAFLQAAQSLSASEGAPPRARLRVWAKMLAWQSAFVRQLGQVERSLHLLKQALALLDSSELTGQDTRAERAFVLFGMGWSTLQRFDEASEQYFGHSLALYRELDDQWWVGRALRGLSDAMAGEDDFEEGRRYASESMAVYRALGDRWEIARSGRMLSYKCALQGQAAEAERLARESSGLRHQVQSAALAGIHLSALGLTLFLSGKYVEALSVLEKSVLLLVEQLSCRRILADTRIDLARALMHQGEYQAARAQVQMALTSAQRLSGRRYSGVAHLTLGQLSLAHADDTGALEWINKSIAALRAIGRHYHLREALACLAYAARRMGDEDRAQRALVESLLPGDGRGALYPVLYALPAAALLLADREHIVPAIELYALASRSPVVANSRWFEDVAGRQIVGRQIAAHTERGAAAATLPSDAVAAAQERGRSRDLWATVRELLAELGRVTSPQS
jgi:tetratricopeptide (TPR) repeat protein